LGVARFSFIPSDGTKAAQVSLVIRTKLRENENQWWMQDELTANDTSVHVIINQPKGKGAMHHLV